MKKLHRFTRNRHVYKSIWFIWAMKSQHQHNRSIVSYRKDMFPRRQFFFFEIHLFNLNKMKYIEIKFIHNKKLEKKNQFSWIMICIWPVINIHEPWWNMDIKCSSVQRVWVFLCIRCADGYVVRCLLFGSDSLSLFACIDWFRSFFLSSVDCSISNICSISIFLSFFLYA